MHNQFNLNFSYCHPGLYLKEYAADCLIKLRRYSVTAQKISTLTFDILFLIAKSYPQALEQLGKVSLVSLSCIGLAAGIYNGDVVRKDWQDFLFARRLGNRSVEKIAAANLAQQLNDFILSLIGTYAAFAGLAGWTGTQALLYQKIRYWGIATTMTSFAINVLLAYSAHQTLKKMQTLTEDDIRQIGHALKKQSRHLFSGLYIKTLQEEELSNRMLWNPEIETFAAQIRLCMDKDTMWKLLDTLEALPDDDLESLKTTLLISRANVATQRNITLIPRILLMAIGAGLLATEDYYTRNSLTAAVCNLTISVLWTLQEIIEKKFEINQRAATDKIGRADYRLQA